MKPKFWKQQWSWLHDCSRVYEHGDGGSEEGRQRHRLPDPQIGGGQEEIAWRETQPPSFASQCGGNTWSSFWQEGQRSSRPASPRPSVKEASETAAGNPPSEEALDPYDSDSSEPRLIIDEDLANLLEEQYPDSFQLQTCVNDKTVTEISKDRTEVEEDRVRVYGSMRLRTLGRKLPKLKCVVCD